MCICAVIAPSKFGLEVSLLKRENLWINILRAVCVYCARAQRYIRERKTNSDGRGEGLYFLPVLYDMSLLFELYKKF